MTFELLPPEKWVSRPGSRHRMVARPVQPHSYGKRIFISTFDHEWLGGWDEVSDKFCCSLAGDVRLMAEFFFSSKRFSEFVALITSSRAALEHILLPDQPWLDLLAADAAAAQDMALAVEARRVAAEELVRIRSDRTR